MSLAFMTPFFPAYVNSRQEDQKDERDGRDDSAQVLQVKYQKTIIVLEFISWSAQTPSTCL